MKGLRLGACLVAQGLVLALAVSCGGSASKKVLIPPSGDAGEAGESAQAGGGRGGRGGSSAGAGAPSGGQGGSSAGASAQGGMSDEAGAAGVAGGGGAAEVGGNAGEGGEPVIDVGEGCVAPASAPLLSPATAGLPVNGLTLWLRGDRGVYATDQQRVCAWADQSGHKFLLNAGGARPLWHADGLGAKPAVEFDATNSGLAIAGVLGIPAASGRTFIAVAQSVDTTGRAYPVQQGQANSAGTYVQIDTNSFDTVGSREGVYVSNNSYDAALATGSDARVLVFTVDTMVPGTPVLSAIEYQVNGAVQSLSRNSGGLGNGNVEDFSLADFTAVGSGAQSYIAEVIVYDRALSIPERTSVATALMARYGIQ